MCSWCNVNGKKQQRNREKQCRQWMQSSTPILVMGTNSRSAFDELSSIFVDVHNYDSRKAPKTTAINNVMFSIRRDSSAYLCTREQYRAHTGSRYESGRERYRITTQGHGCPKD